jgi:hypothetical protein
MTEEDEEFQRLEREVEMRRMVVRRIVEEDDDIQDYKKPWLGLTDEEVNQFHHWKDCTWLTNELVRYVESKLKEKNA